MAETQVYVANDGLIKLIGFQNESTAAYLNAATVTAVVKDLNGVAVTGATSITLSYIAASNGNYHGTIADVAELAVGQKYVAEISANGGAGLQGFWTVPFTAAERPL